jgi:hypothetical protein
MNTPRSGCPINLTLDGYGQRCPDVVPGAICSQFSLTEEFEKMLLVSDDGHVASVTG